MYKKLKDRYLKYYVTDAQLDRYAALGVITAKQAEAIKSSRDMEENSNGGGA